MNAEKTCIVHSTACVQYVYRALICNSWSNMGPRLPEEVAHLQFVSEVAHLQFVSEMAQLQFVRACVRACVCVCVCVGVWVGVGRCGQFVG